jgi:hypothetical protein
MGTASVQGHGLTTVVQHMPVTLSPHPRFRHIGPCAAAMITRCARTVLYCQSRGAAGRARAALATPPPHPAAHPAPPATAPTPRYSPRAPSRRSTALSAWMVDVCSCGQKAGAICAAGVGRFARVPRRLQRGLVGRLIGAKASEWGLRLTACIDSETSMHARTRAPKKLPLQDLLSRACARLHARTAIAGAA